MPAHVECEGRDWKRVMRARTTVDGRWAGDEWSEEFRQVINLVANGAGRFRSRDAGANS
ncbi:hypothetical protein ABZ353_16530 [Streptomyces niveus]|uniref:hypothetical protein n=1 Tax=Streptomyces niveus TaxID=193462 RepID=UPI00340998F1